MDPTFRRAFLRQLCSLPLIGGGFSIIGAVCISNVRGLKYPLALLDRRLAALKDRDPAYIDRVADHLVAEIGAEADGVSVLQISAQEAIDG